MERVLSTNTLDDIFKGTDPNDAPADSLPTDPPAKETKEEEPAAAQGEEDSPKGEDSSEETPPVEEEPPASEKDRMVPLKALEAERKKRQTAETNLEQATAKPALPAPDVIEDQKGFEDHLSGTVDQKLANQRFSMSKIMAKGAYEDYDDMEQVFMEAAQENPALASALQAHEHPSEFAYQEGKKIMAMKEFGTDPVAYKEQVRQEVEAEVRDKLKAEAEAAAEGNALRDIPTSLANEPSVAARGDPKWAGPDTIDDILTRKGDRHL